MMVSTRTLIVSASLACYFFFYCSPWVDEVIASQDQLVTHDDLEEPANEGNPNDLGDGINGLVIDNTVTFIGREFYHHFSRFWSDQGMMDDYILTVREQPTARFGSRVGVEWNRKILFQVFLTPTRSNIERSAKIAAQTIAEHFKIIEIQKLFFVNPDLAPDEL